MEPILVIIHIVVCLFLIVVVLLQHGKGADMGATFGGSSQTLFGTEGPLPLLNKITTSAAIIFMLTSLALAFLSSQGGKGSVMKPVQSVAPPPVESILESAPATIPLPEPLPSGAPTDAVPLQFPGEQVPAAPAPAPAENSGAPAQK